MKKILAMIGSFLTKLYFVFSISFCVIVIVFATYKLVDDATTNHRTCVIVTYQDKNIFYECKNVYVKSRSTDVEIVLLDGTIIETDLSHAIILQDPSEEVLSEIKHKYLEEE